MHDSIKTTQVLDFSLTPEEFVHTRKPFHHIKVKVGSNIDENKHRIRMIREKLGYDLTLTIDANMSWDTDFAIKMIKSLVKYKIDYYEELIAKANWLGYECIRRETQARILLDESVCNYADAQMSVASNACDAINIRISKCGGITSSIQLVQLISKNNLAYQLGAQAAELGMAIALKSIFLLNFLNAK